MAGLALAFLSMVTLLGAYTTAPPVVVVYPLTVSAGANPEAGGNIAVLIAQGLAQHGVTVKPAPPGTQRADYLTAAQAAGADYYVTGFLTALGDEVSMVLQAVSTSSGSIINSTTTVVKTYAEAGGQAPALADAILRHSGRALASLDDPRPAESETPKPSHGDKKNEADVNVKTVGGLFHHKSTVAAAPTQRVLVLQVGGNAATAEAQRAARDVEAAAGRNGFGVQSLPVSSSEGVAHAADFCKNNAGTNALFATTLTVQRNATGQATAAQVDLLSYDCTGTVTERRHGEASATGHGGLDAAIDQAIDAAFASGPKRG
jgi:hypothetical protein